MLPLSPSSNFNDFIRNRPDSLINLIIGTLSLIKIFLLMIFSLTAFDDPDSTVKDMTPFTPLIALYFITWGLLLLIVMAKGFQLLSQHFGLIEVATAVIGCMSRILGYICCCDFWTSFRSPNLYEPVQNEEAEDPIQVIVEPVITVESISQIIFKLVAFRPRLNEILKNFIYVQHQGLANELIQIILDYTYKNRYVM